ncbi:PAAR domain-containing protein [Collimonas humicola]|uniref:PAAR domain-containing protein n=1 Tax=Collimonas humicola TaxID=2825886 RepID=UPI001B8BF4AE|nr:PAAR domain-containing protein [Collimonas humicola]
MSKDIILVGDKTSDNGTVISGSDTDAINGRSIARKGDLVDCPGHDINPIVEGDSSMLLDGRPVALAGHRTQCGCILIGSGNGSVG